MVVEPVRDKASMAVCLVFAQAEAQKVQEMYKNDFFPGIEFVLLWARREKIRKKMSEKISRKMSQKMSGRMAVV